MSPRVSVNRPRLATGACAAAIGSTAPKYSANPTASAAMVPLWPTVKIIQPYRNAGNSPYASRRKTYCPPASGYIAAISAKAKQASSEMSPPAIQIPRKYSGLCTAFAIGAAVRKMPEPMMPPTISSTESVSESPRSSVTACLVTCCSRYAVGAAPCSSDSQVFRHFQRRAA